MASVLCAITSLLAVSKVQVTQFVMAKCPMSTSLHLDFARTVMSHKDLRTEVEFVQSFVGGPVGEGPVNETNWMQCFHGDSECKGHTTMLCAKQVNANLAATAAETANDAKATDGKSIDSYAWFDMVTCMNCGGPGYNITSCNGIEGVTYGTKESIPEDARACAASVGLPWKEIDACATSPTGAALLKASHFKTMELFAKHGGYTPPGHGYRPPLIPNIWIDGTQYNNPLKEALNPYSRLERKVCAEITGSRPSSCAGF
eukprot:gene9997-16505_t